MNVFMHEIKNQKIKNQRNKYDNYSINVADWWIQDSLIKTRAGEGLFASFLCSSGTQNKKVKLKITWVTSRRFRFEEERLVLTGVTFIYHRGHVTGLKTCAAASAQMWSVEGLLGLFNASRRDE